MKTNKKTDKKTKNIRQSILFVIGIMLLSMCLISCGRNTMGKEEGASQTEEQEEDTSAEENPLFLIVKHDAAEESLLLYSYVTGLEHYYEYSFLTQFKDKYGNFSQASEFLEGRVVTIGKRDKDGYLTEVQLSDEVWEYEKIRRFSVDEEKGVFTIADTKYSIREKLYVFSNGERVPLTDLSEDDILTVVGKEKKILSIMVTTGHGTLTLKNTALFDGSFLQLNKDIFALISDSMEMELPEGTYTLKVANDGWGGTTEIEIVRGEITEIDLDTLKGEGKKKGFVTFEIDVEDVTVYIDKEKVDHTQAVEVTYGTHILEIKAEGYEAWKKYLSVNAEEATITIELTEESEEEDSEDTEDTEDSEEDSEDTESETETNTEENTEDTESETQTNTEGNTEDTESETQTNTEENTEDTESETQTNTEEDVGSESETNTEEDADPF